MKKKLSLLLLICILSALSINATVYNGSCGDNVNYSLNTETGLLSITGTGAMEDYIYYSDVPWGSNMSYIKVVEIFDGVTSIGTMAFTGCSGLTSVTIPNSVTSIGSNAFQNCSGLTSITIGNSVTSIGGWAFYNCLGLTSITIPNSVTSIGENAFYDTAWYNNQPDGLVYAGLVAYKYKGTMPENTSITIKEGTLGIGDCAFSGCSGLTSVTIPNSVTSIGSGAFAGTAWYNNQPDGLVYAGLVAYGYKGTMPANTSITIKEGTRVIGDYAFYGCSGLTSVTIPNSVTSIGGSAFYDCSGLTSVTIPNSVTSIGGAAFCGCSGLTSVTIPNSVTSIGGAAFGNCSGLTSVTIPNSVTSIGNLAFFKCSGLTSVTIPNSVTSIGSNAFNFCSGLTSVISEIEEPFAFGSGAFNGISSSCALTVPYGTRDAYIAAGWTTDVFKGGIEEMDNPNIVSGSCGENVNYSLNLETGLLSITGMGAMTNYSHYSYIPWYSNKSYVKTVEISDGVTSIGDYAFYRCSGLTSVTIPSSVTSIGNGAFSYCSDLTSVTIPNSVTSIGYSAFSNCSGLTSVTIGNSVTSIGESAFRNCSVTSVTIPNSVTSIGSLAFRRCLGLTSVTIPNSVTSIGSFAFEDCSGLTSVISEIEEPFAFGTDAFNGISSSCALTVPYGTRDAYIAAGWTTNVFKGGIVEMDNPNIINGSCGANVNYSLNLETGVLSITGTGAMTDYSNEEDVPWYSDRLSITAVEISDGVTSIGSSAFDGTAWYNNQPDGLVYAGLVAYKYKGTMPENTSIIINEGTLGIAGSAFEGCTGLISVTIPNTVKSIAYYAFKNCSNLTEVYCKAENNPTAGGEMFDGVPLSNATLYVPEVSIEKYQSTEPWSGFGNIVKIDEGDDTSEDTDISQLDNVIYVKSLEGHSDSQIELPIQMKNSAAIRGFQFDIYLPEGVTVVKSAKGKILASLTESRLPEDDGHTLTLSEQGDGSIRFLCGSLYDETFTGNDGEIATLTVKIDENMSDGDYPIILRNIKLTETDISKYYETPLVRSTLSVVSYMLGDINGDGKVDVSDYIGIANHILGNTPEGFVLKAADVNEDGLIDVSDYIGVANIILTGSIYGGNSNARMIYFQEERNQEVDPE